MACGTNPPPPDGYRIWRGAVPAELTTWAVALKSQLSKYPYGTQWLKWISDSSGNQVSVTARKDYHPWTFRNGQLVTGCFMGVTLFQQIPSVAMTAYVPGSDTLATPDPTAALFDAGPAVPYEPPETISWPLVGLTAAAAGGIVALFWLALKGAGKASLRRGA